MPRGAHVLADLILRPAEEPPLLHDFNKVRGIPPVVVALAHGGWSDVETWPTKDRFFPGAPNWLNPTPAIILATVVVLGALAGVALGAVFSVRCWRHVVVRKLQWMTAEEFEEMLKRQPDF